jgi:FAD/FMN-containing dehydrogenase
MQPRSAEDVALAVRIIAEAHSGEDDDKCIFAVKSGGHGMFAGASNTPGGVTIDLRYMDDVSVAEDRKTVALGPGNKRGGVYKALEPFGLTVAGGRDDSVGVGGFLLRGE